MGTLPQEERPKSTEAVQKGQEFWGAIKEWFADLIDLEDGLDRDGTTEYIRNNCRMRGANAWMLVCSIMIASLGLDLNSPAVIIGAMLISPLMSPILGVGMGVGINDQETLLTALRHFGISIAIALVTSTLYFELTPFGDFTKEIAARTQPTLLDGLVAVFGGFAGIISVSRLDKSNAIPGVAIATALMPPLCVSGYGLANGEWVIMANAFYLFFLNSFFIAITTFIIIRFLRFPLHTFVNARERRRTQWMIGVFSLVIIIPSAIILSDVLQRVQFQNRVESFKKEYFSDKTQCINSEYQVSDSTNILILQLIGEPINEDSLQHLYKGLEKYGIGDTKLALIQNSDLEQDELNQIRKEMSGLQTVAEKLKVVESVKAAQEKAMRVLKSQVDSLSNQSDTILFNNFTSKAKILFPELENMAFSKMQMTNFKKQEKDLPTLLVKWSRNKTRAARRRDEEKMAALIKLEWKLDTVSVVSY